MRTIDRIKKSSFIKGVLSIGIGNIVGQVITLVTLPILSRIYSQEAYGEYGVLVSLTTIFTSFIALGLTSAIMQPKDNKESAEVAATALITQAGVIALLFCITIAIQDFYKLFEVSGSYIAGVALMYAYAFFANATSIIYTYVNKLGHNKILLLNPIIRACCIVVIALPLGFLHFNYIGFMAAYIAAEFLSSLQMVIRVKPFKNIKKYSWRTYCITMKNNSQYIFYQCPANAIGTFGAQFPTQFLASIFNNVVLGSYTMCCKVISMPVAIISKPIANVYFRTASEYKHENRDLASFTYRIVLFGLLLGAAPLLSVIIWGEPIFAFVLGANWSEAGKMASIVGIQYVLMFIAQCLSYCRVAIGKQRINFFFSLIDLSITVMLCVVGHHFTKDLFSIVTIMTVGKCIVYITDIVLDFVCMKSMALKVAGILIGYVGLAWLLVVLI